MSGTTPRDWPDPTEVALATLPTLTSAARQNLYEAFAGNTEEVFSASESQLLRVKGIGSATAAAIRDINLEAFGARMREWYSMGVRLLRAEDEDYPYALQQLFPLPPLLFARGEWHSLKQRLVVGVVGTRSPSPGARYRTVEIVERIVDLGTTLISGLALGIDSEAHWAAMRVPDSYQIAILGSGVLQVYPNENQPLADALLLGAGTLLSELAPDAEPMRSQFVARNRALAALCGALIVIETGLEGGAMHAARFACEFGRPVFVVADAEALGNRQLLKDRCQPLPSDLTEVLIAAGKAMDEKRGPVREAGASLWY